MSDSRPPIFDDGGGLPDVDRSRRRTDPGGPGSAEKTVWDSDDDDWHGPNYLARRAIVVALVVAVIAVAAVLVGRILGSDDSGSGSGFGNADWNNVVTVDNNSGTVVVTNDKPLKSFPVRGLTMLWLALLDAYVGWISER